MSNIEEEFMRVFEIEPKTYAVWDSKNTQIENFESVKEYPEITAEILLKMILILMNSEVNVNIQKGEKPITLNDFKYCLLTACIEQAERIGDKFQSLFEGEGEE